MAYRYDTMTKRVLENDAPPHRPDSVQLSAGVVLAIIPFDNKSTFNFSTQVSVSGTAQEFQDANLYPVQMEAALSPDVGFDIADHKRKLTEAATAGAGGFEAYENEIALATKGIWQVQNLCYDVTVSHSKGSHVGQLSAMLVDPYEKLYANITPGDWVVCCMLDNEADYLRVSSALRKGEPINGFNDGLKFLGRVQSIRRSIVTDTAGHKSRRINLQAASFIELDSPIFWNPALVTDDNGTNQSWFGIIQRSQGMSELLQNLHQHLPFVDEAILALLLLFLGVGPTEAGKNPTDSIGALVEKTPNEAYLLPNSVGRVFGVSASSGDNLRYCDLIHVISGIQKYSKSALYPDLPEEESIPGFAALSNFTLLGERLIGRMSPVTTPWANVPIWQILSQYANLEANEMYTTLKADAHGNIQPTMIVRQQPFTSDLYNKHSLITRFSELPRWVIGRDQVSMVDLGRSDALRHNFVSITAFPSGAEDPTGNIDLVNRASSPPVSDRADIKRSGLKPIISTINVDTFVEGTRAQKRTEYPPEMDPQGTRSLFEQASLHWSSLIADFRMGGHLRETGGMMMHGLQCPIAVGDNVEYDGNLYHLESITHRCSKSAEGRVSFTTSLSVTHGTSLGKIFTNSPWPHLDSWTPDLKTGPVVPATNIEVVSHGDEK